MRFIVASDTEAVSLHRELVDRATDTDADGLMTANVWLWMVEQPSPDALAIVSSLLAQPGFPGRQWLEPNLSSAPWVALTAEAAATAALRLLTGGQSLEVPAFQGEPVEAARFTKGLLAWVGSPVAALASWEHRPGGVSRGFGVFRLPHWFDEGLALVGPQRVALLWFVGTD